METIEEVPVRYPIPKIVKGRTRADIAFCTRVQDAFRYRDFDEIEEAFNLYGAYLTLIDID